MLPPGIIVVSFPAVCSGWAPRRGGCYSCSGREEQAPPTWRAEQSEEAAARAAAAAESAQAPPSNFTIYIHLYIHTIHINYKLG